MSPLVPHAFLGMLPIFTSLALKVRQGHLVTGWSVCLSVCL